MRVDLSLLNDSSPDGNVVFNVEPEVAYANAPMLLKQHLDVVDGGSRVHRFGLANVVSVDHKEGLYMPNYVLGPMTKLEFKDLRQGMENIVIRSAERAFVRSFMLSEPITQIDNSDNTIKTDSSGWLGGTASEYFQQHFWVSQTVQGDGVNTKLEIEGAEHGEYLMHITLERDRLLKRFFVYDAVKPSLIQNVRLSQCVEQSFTHGIYMLYPSVNLPIRTAKDIPAMPGTVPDVQPAPVKPEPADGNELEEGASGAIPPMPGDPSGDGRPDNPDWWTGKDK